MSGMRTFNVFDAEFEYDDSDPEGYRSGYNRFGPKVGGSRLGATVYELPPGQALCPYHYETEEEWLMVLQGEPTIRTPEGESVLRPGDVVAFAASSAGAHKATNHSTDTVRLLMWATSDPSGACVYPDSGNVLLWNTEGSTRRKLGPEVSYYDGEPLGAR